MLHLVVIDMEQLFNFMLVPNKLVVEQRFLLNKLRKGDKEAYELLFKEYYTRLVIYSDKILRDTEIAREVVQDLFVNLYEKRDSLNISTSLSSYLYKAAYNRCMNYLKSLKTKEKYIQETEIYNNMRSNVVEDFIEQAEMEAHLLKLISDLPERCRLIFTLNRFKGLSNTEIANKLNLSKRTVETQISKALKILRDNLKRYYPESVFIVFFLGFIIKIFFLI